MQLFNFEYSFFAEYAGVFLLINEIYERLNFFLSAVVLIHPPAGALLPAPLPGGGPKPCKNGRIKKGEGL